MEPPNIPMSATASRPPQKTKQCAVCHKSEIDGHVIKSCSKCNHAHYCSVQCQKSDWPKHKIACPIYQEAKEEEKHLIWVYPTRGNAAVLEPILDTWVEQYKSMLKYAVIHGLKLHSNPDNASEYMLTIKLMPTTVPWNIFPRDPEHIPCLFTPVKLLPCPEQLILSTVTSEDLRGEYEAQLKMCRAKTKEIQGRDTQAVGCIPVLISVIGWKYSKLIPVEVEERYAEVPERDPQWCQKFSAKIDLAMNTRRFLALQRRY